MKKIVCVFGLCLLFSSLSYAISDECVNKTSTVEIIACEQLEAYSSQIDDSVSSAMAGGPQYGQNINSTTNNASATSSAAANRNRAAQGSAINHRAQQKRAN